MISTLEIFYDLDIQTTDHKSHKKIYDKFKEEDRQKLGVRFWQYSRKN